ncbi:nitrate regulatory gene2 protein-like [Miscanthus floridulus]|uniref:nitrate regulatory gene2 protein-like n=1 Tax=Miscanthus floridulus TaxID=154761 RepID=UPI00345A57D2
MGCRQIDQEEAVCRCRERKRLMADAVVSRNGFAAAHTGYTVRLKSTGGALSDFAQGEAPNLAWCPPIPTTLPLRRRHLSRLRQALPQLPSAAPPRRRRRHSPTSLILASKGPPPLPIFLEIPKPEPRAPAKKRPPADAPIREEDEDEDEEEDDGHIKTDSDSDSSDDDDSDEDDDHHEHDDVNVDGMEHGHQSKRILMSSVGSSPVTPPPPQG